MAAKITELLPLRFIFGHADVDDGRQLVFGRRTAGRRRFFGVGLDAVEEAERLLRFGAQLPDVVEQAAAHQMVRAALVVLAFHLQRNKKITGFVFEIENVEQLLHYLSRLEKKVLRSFGCLWGVNRILK